MGSPHYEGVRKIRDLIYHIKNEVDRNANIITRGMRHGCENHVKKYAIDFGLRYTEYNPAHTEHTLYSGMNESYYGKQFHPTQKLHQYDSVVMVADKIFYFGGIKPSEQKHLERQLTKLNKKIVYLD